VEAVERKQPGWTGFLRGETGHSKNYLGFFLLFAQIESSAVETEDLCRIREVKISDELGAGPDRTGFDAAMTFGRVSVLRGEKPRDRGLGCLA
jgi:hypothetical protein